MLNRPLFLKRPTPYWILALLAWFSALTVRPLFNPDEGRYAEIPREMLASGDFILPRLNDLIYLEKPPLQYWLTALVYRLVGVSPWSARLGTATAAVLGIYVVYRTTRAHWGARRAEIAALMASSMLLYVFMGQLLTLDMLLSVTVLVAIAAFCRSQQLRDQNPHLSKQYAWGCWLAMALATLTKGLIGIVIPGAILVLYTFLARDWRVWRHLQLIRGALIYAIVVVPWFALVERAHPGALWFLIIHEHFQRYLTTVHERYQPAWYFLPILAVGVLPWLPQALRSLATQWRRSVPVGEFDTSRLLWVAVVLIVGFFSASDSKLAPYILPTLPLLAILGSAPNSLACDLKISALLAIAVSLTLAVLILVMPVLKAGTNDVVVIACVTPWMWLAAAIIFGAGVSAWIALPDGLLGVRRLALGHFLAGLLLATFGANSLSWKYSGSFLMPELSAAVAQHGQSLPIYAFRTYDWTLPVYTKQALIPVQWVGELEYGLRVEPEKGIADLTEFGRQWTAREQALMIVTPSELPVLRAAGVPYRELKTSSELLLLSRR